MSTVVVSGYPRSGTSMMMQFMYHGGIPIIADPAKQIGGTEFNPYGSWELDNVGPELNALSPEETEGKVVKLVAPYIHWLPLDRPCKVIFMLRDTTEVITSLLAMHTVWNHMPSEAIALARKFLKENAIPTLFLHFKEVLKYPKTTGEQIEDFIGSAFDAERAMCAVDPEARKKFKGKGQLATDAILGFDFDYMVSEEDTVKL